MRILESTQRFPPAIGGGERHVEGLATELTRAGVQVVVSTSDLQRDRPFARLSPAREDSPFSVRRHRAVRWFPAPHGLGIWAPGMGRDMLGGEFDVVHAHAFGYFPTWAGAWTRRIRSSRLIITPHTDAGRRTSGSRLYARGVARTTVSRADRTVALTNLEAEYLQGLGIDAARIVVIPNGIDLGEFEQLPNRDATAPGLTVLFVGRIYPEQKGLEPLVRALAATPPTLDVRLRLVGEDWGGTGPLRALALQLGVGHRLTTTGPLSRAGVLNEYAHADLFVLPSLFEPFGIVLLEAMASGVPIIATRVGGIPEVVEEGRTALLVPPADPAALGEAIGRLGGDERMRRRFAAAGRERVARFAWPRLIPRFLALFEEVASGRSG